MRFLRPNWSEVRAKMFRKRKKIDFQLFALSSDIYCTCVQLFYFHDPCRTRHNSKCVLLVGAHTLIRKSQNWILYRLLIQRKKRWEGEGRREREKEGRHGGRKIISTTRFILVANNLNMSPSEIIMWCSK